MARSPFVRNNTLWMSAAATLIGLAFTVLAFLHDGQPSGWTAFYERTVPTSPDNWNLAIQILAPVVLVTGLWYLVEQIKARRKFEEIMDLGKKSEFNQRLPELKEEVRKLPTSFEEDVEAKEKDFRSRRSQ
jgi:hypothetical protein